MEQITVEALADRLRNPAGRRRIVAVAGPPASGKSTLAERLKEAIGADADILPMDGYHFDDAILEARGDRARKGAPHTFDVDGLRAMLERLRLDDGREVAVPVFDRAIEISRAGGRIISAGVRTVVVEGNYLLLDEPGWRDLKPYFDVTVWMDYREDELVRRMIGRWEGYGFPPEAISAKLEVNDLPNIRFLLARVPRADFVIGG